MTGWKNITVALSAMLVMIVTLWIASQTMKRVEPAEVPPLHSAEREVSDVNPDTIVADDPQLSAVEKDTLTEVPPGTKTPAAFDTAAAIATRATPKTDVRSLVIPVAGVRVEQLADNYMDERSDGRTHQAIDIMAAHGTPVLATADGRIVRLFQSDLGGTTIYQQSADSAFIFYYAHLDSYAAGITDGTMVRRGDVIGYVGDTGNAGPGNYHLHFAIWRVTDPKRYWDGENINPYPVLKGWRTLGEHEPATTGERHLQRSDTGGRP